MSKAAALLRFLLARLQAKTHCRRCRGTGAWLSGDCPDCGGSGKLPRSL